MQGEFWPSTGPTCGDGTTCEPSHPSPLTSGDATSLPEDSPVRTSVSPVKEQDSTESGRDSGTSSRESFAFFDPDTCLWKTSQLCLFGDSMPFSGRWPRTGTMQNGRAFRLPPLVPRISGRESFWWPTPRVNDGRKGANCNPMAMRSGLPAAVRRWPTPSASDHKDSYSPGQRRGQLSEAVQDSGKLDPEFVEWLMGFPIGWSDLEGSAMP
jgi:hypothetical protein